MIIKEPTLSYYKTKFTLEGMGLSTFFMVKRGFTVEFRYLIDNSFFLKRMNSHALFIKKKLLKKINSELYIIFPFKIQNSIVLQRFCCWYKTSQCKS